MPRTTLLIVLLFACKKEPAQGLPPANDWGSSGGSNALPAPQPRAGTAPDQLPPDHPPVGTMPPDHPVVGTMPPDHPAVGSATGPMPSGQGTASKTLAKLGDGRFALGPYSIAVPAGWTAVATKSDMRAAQFKIGNDAELVVYYFGPDGAGSVEDNVDRWLGQFTQANGKPAKDVAKLEHVKILGFDATIVSVTGHYQAMAMPGGGEAVDKNDQSLLAAITGSPSGPYYWKLVGSRATVAANTEKFRTLLTTLKLTQ